MKTVLKSGTVIKTTGSWYAVRLENGSILQSRIVGKFRLDGKSLTNPVAVGDHVVFEKDTVKDEEIGVISKIEKRENYIIRKSVNLSKQTQIIAANIDLAFLIVTLNNPPTSTAFIDRFLVTSEAYGIKTILLFNKIDSYDYYREKVYSIDTIKAYDRTDLGNAFQKSLEEEKLPTGIFYQVQKPAYEDGLRQIDRKPLVDNIISDIDMNKLFNKYY